MVSCIGACLRKLSCCGQGPPEEDAEEGELIGLSAARGGRQPPLPPSAGGKCRKFQHGFRPNKHGKPHMSHEIDECRDCCCVNSSPSPTSDEMAEGRRKRLQELLKKSGNSTCAECGRKSEYSFQSSCFVNNRSSVVHNIHCYRSTPI